MSAGVFSISFPGGRGSGARETTYVAGTENRLVPFALQCLESPTLASGVPQGARPADPDDRTTARSMKASPTAALGDSSPERHAALEEAALENAAAGPFVFYGPTGSGKSLLAHGVAERFRRRTPSGAKGRVLLLTGQEFARQVAHAIDADALSDAVGRWKRSRLLVIDDLEGVCSSASAQRVLAATLDTRGSLGEPVVLTCRRPPWQMVEMQVPLASRAAAGLVVPLHHPRHESLGPILSLLFDREQIPHRTDSAEVLASAVAATGPVTMPRLLRVLEAYGEHTRASAASRGGPEVEHRLLAEFLRDLDGGSRVQLATITSATARYFRMPVREIRGPSRRRNVVRARGVVVWLARQREQWSLQAIGAHLGRRDHTTILHAWRRTRDLLAQDDELKLAVDEINERLNRATQLNSTARESRKRTTQARGRT